LPDVPGSTDDGLHRDVAALGSLLGTWVGHGEGDYPTVEPFGYREETLFWHDGRPFLGYQQRTWRGDGRPSHTESGYWRGAGAGRVELVVALANGMVEVSEGTLRGTALTMTSAVVARTVTAKEVTAVTRRITVDGDELSGHLEMEAVGIPLRFHLRTRLRRTDAGGGR
jgi:hypothetical protein